MSSTALLEGIPQLLARQCISGDIVLSNQFSTIIQHLYQYQIFKNILDIVMTQCSAGQLHFKLQNSKFFDLDAGNCLTMVEGNNKKYVITIKKMVCDVIMHEIGHLLEQELKSIINLGEFASMLMYDINNIPKTQMHMQQIINSLFVEQVNGYPPSQHISELFARFFQIFAGADEVAFQSSLGSKYGIKHVTAIFNNTLVFLDKQLSNRWNNLIDPRVAKSSEKYVKTLDEIEQRWADQKVKAIHQGTGKKWSSGVKSNKDDVF